MGKLDNLNEDIALAILLLCDAFTILKMEQTCSVFRMVSRERHLWLTLATNLDYDHAPNLAPHESLQSLSTERIREMVIRSARVYTNWNSPRGPRPSRSIVFDLRIESVRLAKLLPGGRYFIAVDWDFIVYCYDTDTQNQIGSYIGASSRGEFIYQIDCLVLEAENALALAYGAHREDLQTSVTIVRFDICSGTSEIARSITLARDGEHRSTFDVMIGREVVVVLEGMRILVWNWRTGEATVIVEEQHHLVYHRPLILHNHLFVVSEMSGDFFDVTAIPLSTFFRDRHGRDSGKPGASASYTSVRSQDVFRDSTRVNILDSNGDFPHYIVSMSVCTSSWKTPSTCEHDAPATPTRILLLSEGDHDEYKVFELLFSPPSIGPINHDLPQNGYRLTCQQQSLPRFKQNMFAPQFTSAPRTGRLVCALHAKGDYAVPHSPRAYVTAIDMLDLLKETLPDGSNNSVSNERPLGQMGLQSPIDNLVDGDLSCNNISIEPYSGAIWYCFGPKLFIHCTD